MSWAVWAGRSGSSRWAKWVDVDQASRWLMAIESIVTRADNSTLMGDQRAAVSEALARGGAGGPGVWSDEEYTAWLEGRFVLQQQRVVDLATAILGFATAADMEVFALAPYAPARIQADNGGADYGPTSSTPSAATVAALYDVTGGTRRQEVFQLVVARYAEVREAEDLQLDLFWRVDYSAEGTVRVLTDVIDPDSGVDRREGVAATSDRWNPWDGWIVKTWVPGFGAASRRAEVTVLAPLSWIWDLLLRVGRLMVARRINGTLALSQGWVAARNVRLSRVLGGTGLPATIVEASAAVDVATLGQGGFPPAVDTLLASVVAVAAAANPIAGLVLGIVVGLAELLAHVIPPAVAYASDCWGRRLPFLQAFNRTGKLAPREAPTHTLLEVSPLFARVELADPNPWAEGLMSSDPAERAPGADPPATEPGAVGGGTVVALVAAALAFFSR